jgi:hypothetical protein
MRASIYHNAKNDRQYSASTGLKIAEFEKLFKVFEEYFNPKKTLLIGKSKQPVFQDKREALFFILYYFKTGLTYQVLGLSFGISDVSAISYVELLKPVLKTALRKLEVLPKSLFQNQVDFEKAFEGVEDIFIDCTEIPVARADEYEKQEEFYSGKKNNTP